MINVDLEAIQKIPNKTSIYYGVSWNKDQKKWYTQLKHNRNNHCGGYFDEEEHAAMKVNLLCDKYETERKNPMINVAIPKYEKTKSKMDQSATENIVNEEVKIEDENILHGFKNQCEHRFIQSNDEESCIDTALCQNQKRKRKEEPMINDIKLEIAPPNYDQNELLEKI